MSSINEAEMATISAPPLIASTSQYSTKLPLKNFFFLLTLLVCLLPMALLLLGVDFSSPPLKLPQNIASITNIEPLFAALSGAFTHTILEWSAFAVAFFTGLAALNHFHVTKDITTPIIGIALLCSGSMDAFHTLAADRLFSAVADNKDLIPFTWAVSRIFNAGLMILGISLLLRQKNLSQKNSLMFVSSMAGMFILIGVAIIIYCANSQYLPQTQYPEAWITRPYDIIPLVMFIFAGLVIYPKFLKKYPSIFAYSLLLSVIPEIAIELHMAFGSSDLFDAHFNIAHFLKILAYLIPLIGLAIDYIKTYQSVENNLLEIRVMKNDIQAHLKQLSMTNEQLSRSNSDLEQFAFAASHDLREPLRKIQAFGNLLEDECQEQLSTDGKLYISTMQRAANRMEGLISSLLAYSRLGQQNDDFSAINLTDVINDVLQDLEIAIKESDAMIIQSELPTVRADLCKMRQLFQNIISNSIKFKAKDRPLIINISATEIEKNDINYWQITIVDNGIGFNNDYQNKIFDIFKRLHGMKAYPGSGIGLSLCKRIIEHHNGVIIANGIEGKSAEFKILLPKDAQGAIEDEQ
ncbi:MAG: ATP-binding protein [Colwellia sp.]|nr:ATP-binding protein [Colwellia sp.]